jgi:hypothetical protein
MKRTAIAIGLVAAVMGANAFAEEERNTPYDVDRVTREQWREVYRDNPPLQERYYSRDDRAPDYSYREYRGAPRECWNPRARHYEGVREGERQDDLDYSRCRLAYGDSRRWR